MVSTTFVAHEVHHILPILYEHLNYINWPSQWNAHPFQGVVAAIDGTAHFRSRIHPRQGDFYRSDKHAHFLAAQVVCSLQGTIFNMTLTQGHNNDQANFKISGMKDYLEEKQLFWLADNGYTHHRLIVPDTDMPASWNNTQKRLRSVVETVIGLVKNWKVACNKYRGRSARFQALLLLVVYQLTASSLLRFPLRRQGQ